MNVQDLPNYGKDLFTIGIMTKTPLRKKLALLPPVLCFLGGIIQILGLRGTVRMIRQFKAEVTRAQTLDWTHLDARGLTRQDLLGIIRKIVLAKVLADTLGMETAARLRNAMSNAIAYDALEEVFAPPEIFLRCGNGDFLTAFKQYYVALMQAMEKRGLEAAEVVEDTPDTFQINVTYCAWAEVAKTLGNAYYCYYSTCYGDEVFFPKLCAVAGFQYHRTGILATGKPVCDHRFTRLEQLL
ncbi:MAG: hypothetical protein EHM21_16435 [Chloroflexi bacterium]|nr:MAG: hypothetical protein EHM21_16435 [Chloroflexota bacterium]